MLPLKENPASPASRHRALILKKHQVAYVIHFHFSFLMDAWKTKA